MYKNKKVPKNMSQNVLLKGYISGDVNEVTRLIHVKGGEILSGSGQRHGLGETHSENVHIAENMLDDAKEQSGQKQRCQNGADCENVGCVTANASSRNLLHSDGSGPEGASKGPVTRGQDTDIDDLKQKSVILRAIERAEKETDLFTDSSTEENPHIFSAEYEARKQNMMLQAFGGSKTESKKKNSIHSVRSRKHIFRIPGRAAVAACLAILIMGAGMFAVNAVAMPEPIRKLMIAVQEQFSSSVTAEDILFGDNRNKDYPGTIETKYEPKEIIHGYKEDERIETERTIRISFVNDEEDSYVFQQITFEQWNAINTENVGYSILKILDNIDGILYGRGQYKRLTWVEHDYVFSISGEIDTDVLRQIAASVEVVQ